MSSTSQDSTTGSEVIVVGAADTETAAIAVDRAAQLASVLNGRLIVVRAYSDATVDVVGVGDDIFMLSEGDDAQAFADQMAVELANSHRIEATGVVRRGKPEDVILDVARESQATLIVVGNVRMQGAGRLLGSVANGVAHRAPCDVLVVKTT